MKKNRGFTYIEVIMAMFMLTTVIVVANTFWFFIRNNYEFISSNFRLTQSADKAARTLSTELRQAEEAMNGAYPLYIVEDNQLSFYADADGDGSVERIRYFVQNRNLMKGIIKASGNPPQYNGTEKITILVEQVNLTNGPLFHYYNNNWPADTTNNPLISSVRILETRMIEVTIPLEIKSANGTTTHAAHTMVHLRNL